MTLKAGSRIGSYEVTSPLGEGGMGIVFRARDVKLQRDVALKLLPDHFADDSDRLARFQREAQVLASLNHPNIAQIYGLEDSTAQRCIVMELVEGETLADRLRRGALPLDETLQIARQVCEALAAAHEKGIIHRDLKPANIKLTADGKVKVLDFGLAKALENAPANTGFSNSPTLSMAATNAGIILGTAAYMSPEQAKGFPADARSDVFSFGCVLYEMLTGKQTFQGETVSEILASVLVRDPDFSVLPPNLNARLQEVLHRCLNKNPKRRFHAVADLQMEMETIASNAFLRPGADQVAVGPQSQPRFWIMAFALASVAAIALGVLVFRGLLAPTARNESRSVIRFGVPEPKDAPFPANPVEPLHALSPDGQRLVFRAQKQGQAPTLWMRSFDTLEAKELSGTDGAFHPFWSPDSRFVGFFADGKLKKIDILGGSAQTLAEARVEGATWNQDGTILFGGLGAGVMRVASVGGTPTPATTLDAAQKEGLHIWPEFLPDGRHFIYITSPNWTAYLGSLDSKERKLLLRADSKVVHAPGYLLFVRGTTLTAQAFDDRSLELRGEPFPIAEDVRVNSALARAAFSASMNGTVTYRTLSGGQVFELLWFDRSGKPLGPAGPPANYQGIALSPDGRQLAVHRHENGNNGGDIWLLDLMRSNLTRFTFDPNKHYEGPIWSRDGASVFYLSQTPPRSIYRKATNGAGTEETLVQQESNSTAMFPDNVAPDGKFLMYQERDPKTNADLWLLPLSGDRKRVSYLQTPFIEGDAQISPSSRWAAYTSNEGGRMEVYLRPFPNASGGKWQISTGGGDFARWRGDSKELFFITYDRKLMAVDIGERNGAPEIGVPHVLFETRISHPAGASDFYAYDVSRDGQRFIMSALPADSAQSSSPITVVLNWAASLKK